MEAPRRDPTRWRDDPAAPSESALILRAVRRPQLPAPDDLARLSMNVSRELTARAHAGSERFSRNNRPDRRRELPAKQFPESRSSHSPPSPNALCRNRTVSSANNYALNPSFEADRVSMTVPAGWKSTSGSNVQDGHTGRWSWQLSANGTLQQQIAGLPAGTYTLSVWVKGSGSGTLFAKGCGGTDGSMSLGSGTAFHNVSLPGVTASGGACTIGVTAGSGQVTADDFVMSDG